MGSACLCDKDVENQASDEKWMLNRNERDACLLHAKEASLVLRRYSFTIALK